MVPATQLGVESVLTEYLAQGRTVVAQVRLITNSDVEAIKVSVRARVFDYDQVARTNVVPNQPLSEGPAIDMIVTREPTQVKLHLPELKPGLYSVAAKVRSADERYSVPFEPSNCYIGVVPYEIFQMRAQELREVYAPDFADPKVSEEVRVAVRRGTVIAADEGGLLLRAADQNGQLILTPIPPVRSVS